MKISKNRKKQIYKNKQRLNLSSDTDFSSIHRAPYIRRKQNEDLSMTIAKRGVDKIREGENAAAIQHFNKALTVYENNIEALVGRAAAYVIDYSYISNFISQK